LSKKTTREIGLLPPERAPLASEHEREAAALLANLLLDVAAKRRGVRSAGVFGGVSGGAIGSVIPFPEKRTKAREAA
jgi:hypothetical protein